MQRLGSFALAAVLAAILVPQNALADVTHSAITTPSASPTRLWVDLNARTATLDVSGTSDGTTGDTVDVLCFYSDEDGPEADDLADGVPVDASGNFSFTAGPSELGALRGDNCVLRAIPSDSDPDTVTQYTGPQLLVGGIQRSSLQSGPNTGAVYDYDVIWPQLAGVFETESTGACGLADSGVFGPGPTRSVSVFYCAGFAWPSDGTQDMIRVDGHSAYTPWGSLSAWAVANSGSTDVPGMPTVQVDATADPTTGELTIHETTPLVICSPAPDTYPATADSCSSFQNAGVVLRRTIVQDHDGKLATVRDAWASTDGAAHQLDVEYESDFASAAGVFRLGWSDPSFQAYPPGTAITPPGGHVPISIYQADSSAVSPGDPGYAAGAVSLAVPPDGIAFTRGTSQGASALVVSYQRQVPAGGVLELDSAYSQAGSVSGVQALVGEAERALAAPTLSITSPKDGATIAAGSVTVTGTVHDANGLASLTVEGKAVHPNSAGSWSTTVSLARGTNTIDIVAKDNAGNTTTASVTVTSTSSGGGSAPGLPGAIPDPPKGLVGCMVPPKLHGQPLKLVKRAILKWHCRPGKVVQLWSKTVYTGRVIGARPHSGTHLKAGAHVIIVQSKGKKPRTGAAPRTTHARGGDALKVA